MLSSAAFSGQRIEPGATPQTRISGANSFASVFVIILTTAIKQLDILVNNASVFYPTPLQNTSENDWHKIIDSNLMAPFFLHIK
jgi:NAD(P)-dependent dehydrogenase (short-subunit alcohol dehydrogenase family)